MEAVKQKFSSHKVLLVFASSIVVLTLILAGLAYIYLAQSTPVDVTQMEENTTSMASIPQEKTYTATELEAAYTNGYISGLYSGMTSDQYLYSYKYNDTIVAVTMPLTNTVDSSKGNFKVERTSNDHLLIILDDDSRSLLSISSQEVRQLPKSGVTTKLEKRDYVDVTDSIKRVTRLVSSSGINDNIDPYWFQAQTTDICNVNHVPCFLTTAIYSPEDFGAFSASLVYNETLSEAKQQKIIDAADNMMKNLELEVIEAPAIPESLLN